MSSPEDASSGEDEPQDSLDDIKERGNLAWKQGKHEEAMQIWHTALKEALKLSVRGITTRAGIDLQMSLRLNLAQGHLQNESWSEAINQCEIVLHDQPTNIKALYRKAKGHMGIQEWEASEEICNEICRIEPNNVNACALLNEIRCERAAYRGKSKSMFKGMFKTVKPSPSAARIESPNSSPSIPLQSEISSFVGPKLWPVQWDFSDTDAGLWSTPQSLESLTTECNMPLTRALPLTILYSLETIYSQSYSSLSGLCASDAATTAPLVAYDSLQNLRKDRLTIHCIGVDGRHEMKCKFSHILHRWKHVETLILVLIGFREGEPSFSDRMKEGELSKPMAVNTPDSQEQIAVTYKGLYQDFVHHYPGVLTNEEHVFYPDLCVLGCPGLSSGLSDWIPALIELIKSDKLCILTGNSNFDLLSHDAVEMQVILEEIGADIVLPVQRNRFPILLDRKDLHEQHKGNGIQDLIGEWQDGTLAPLAKHAVICAFKGLMPGKSVDELPTSAEQIAELKQRLIGKGINLF